MRTTKVQLTGVLALTALAAGGLAVAQGQQGGAGSANRPAVYHYAGGTAPGEHGANGRGYELVSDQLLIPADGSTYHVTGKATLRSGRRVKAGSVTCQLGGIGKPNDVSSVVLRPGDRAAMAFDYIGTTGDTDFGVTTVEMSCSSSNGPYKISDVTITAMPVTRLVQEMPVD